MTVFAVAVGFLALAAWIYLALFHGRFWQILLETAAPDPVHWPSVDIVVPARNEAAALPHSLPSLLAQDYPGMWRVILVDDHSEDGTPVVARTLAAAQGRSERLSVALAPDLAGGWTGKVAAMQAGAAQSSADYVLFTDADIEHPVDSLRRLVARAVDQKLDLVSRMVKLSCTYVSEKLLIPPFVFFFAMLYPFARANDPRSRVAAAAGGVMLLRRRALDAVGGLAAIRSALIDDCALARAIQAGGGRIELTLTRDIKSVRPYPRISDITDMIARSAYTQLQYSLLLLTGTVLGMGLLFVAPLLLCLSGWPLCWEAGLGACVIMLLIYLPMVRFYQLPAVWSLALPVAACLYILATIDSARLYAKGRGGQWKGRAQA